SRFFGFLPLYYPQQQYPYFNLIEGVFSNNLPAHSHVLQEPHTAIFVQLLQTDFEASHRIKMHRNERKYLLEKILEFYRLHTENFGQLNSLYIFEDLFNYIYYECFVFLFFML